VLYVHRMNEPTAAMILLQKMQTFDIMDAVQRLRKLVGSGRNRSHSDFTCG